MLAWVLASDAGDDLVLNISQARLLQVIFSPCKNKLELDQDYESEMGANNTIFRPLLFQMDTVRITVVCFYSLLLAVGKCNFFLS